MYSLLVEEIQKGPDCPENGLSRMFLPYVETKKENIDCQVVFRFGQNGDRDNP